MHINGFTQTHTFKVFIEYLNYATVLNVGGKYLTRSIVHLSYKNILKYLITERQENQQIVIWCDVMGYWVGASNSDWDWMVAREVSPEKITLVELQRSKRS